MMFTPAILVQNIKERMEDGSYNHKGRYAPN